MNAVIVGGGKVGSHLASTLAKEGHNVSLVEVDPDRCEMLEGVMEGVKVVCGDGDEPYILEDADIRNADAVVAATGHDEDNLVVCLLSKLEYSIPMTIARINNPANAWLFTGRFGVDVPVSNTAIMADVLKKVSLGDIVTLLRLNAENMAIDELVLPEDSPAVGKRLADLSLPAVRAGHGHRLQGRRHRPEGRNHPECRRRAAHPRAVRGRGRPARRRSAWGRPQRRRTARGGGGSTAR